ncbi:hypothetical protein SKAU_G00125330 [Synaphobranchus kaupii]|uniref:Uncharacterized protein n=1 Tax=Synaphobranchus kaupii TaxID=118154 RepID=A0A9Q1FQA5_SYNKA|nr:hypothetical protein SKAU_G00125330 [Synaphobranchus kaupii]
METIPLRDGTRGRNDSDHERHNGAGCARGTPDQPATPRGVCSGPGPPSQSYRLLSYLQLTSAEERTPHSRSISQRCNYAHPVAFSNYSFSPPPLSSDESRERTKRASFPILFGSPRKLPREERQNGPVLVDRKNEQRVADPPWRSGVAGGLLTLDAAVARIGTCLLFPRLRLSWEPSHRAHFSSASGGRRVALDYDYPGLWKGTAAAQRLELLRYRRSAEQVAGAGALPAQCGSARPARVID